MPISVADLPLASACVLELTQGVSGPFCGKLLAEFVAQVVKVEPPTGEITRHRAPFPHAQADLEESLQDLYLNTAKCSITLQLGCRAGMRLFKALLHRQIYAGWLGVRPHEQARLRSQGVL